MLVKKNGKWKIEKDDLLWQRCYVCNRPANERHHIIYGRANRAKCDKEGLTIPLCTKCHWNLHNKHIKDKELKELAKSVWLQEHNNDIKKWHSIFNKY